jgi:hypothetical protein
LDEKILKDYFSLEDFFVLNRECLKEKEIEMFLKIKNVETDQLLAKNIKTL